MLMRLGPWYDWHSFKPLAPQAQVFTTSIHQLHTLFFSSHGILFLSIAMTITDLQFSQMVAFFHADEMPIFSGSDPSQLHIARYDWVFLLAISNQMEAFGLLLRLNDDDLHLANCGQCGQRGTMFYRLWCKREAGNQRYVGLQYWSYGGCKVFGGSSEWPTCQTTLDCHKGTVLRCWPCCTYVQQDWNYVRLIKDVTWYSFWC